MTVIFGHDLGNLKHVDLEVYRNDYSSGNIKINLTEDIRMITWLNWLKVGYDSYHIYSIK
jgi:hypothetical protein